MREGEPTPGGDVAPGAQASEPRWKRALRLVLPVVVVAAGVGLVVLLRATAPAPEREEDAPRAPLVDVVRAERGDVTPRLTAHRTVLAAQRARIAPQASGA